MTKKSSNISRHPMTFTHQPVVTKLTGSTFFHTHFALISIMYFKQI